MDFVGVIGQTISLSVLATVLSPLTLRVRGDRTVAIPFRSGKARLLKTLEFEFGSQSSSLFISENNRDSTGCDESNVSDCTDAHLS